MLNPAFRVCMLATFTALAASCTTPGPGPGASRSAAGDVGIDTGHRILMSSSDGPRLDIEVKPVAAGGSAATLTHNDREWRVTTADCAALRIALEEWRAFPSIRPGPPVLQTGPSTDLIPSGLLHGYGDWTIRTEAAVPDNYPVTLTIHDSGGLYAMWADRAVRGIMRCAGN